MSKNKLDISKTLLNDRMLVVLPIDEPSPVAYINVFEPGDVWLKIRGCEDCDPQRRIKCCGNCRLASTAGCFLHIEGRGQNKPYYCVVQPTPKSGNANCTLEYVCIQGSMKGKIRRLTDTLDETMTQ